MQNILIYFLLQAFNNFSQTSVNYGFFAPNFYQLIKTGSGKKKKKERKKKKRKFNEHPCQIHGGAKQRVPHKYGGEK